MGVGFQPGERMCESAGDIALFNKGAWVCKGKQVEEHDVIKVRSWKMHVHPFHHTRSVNGEGIERYKGYLQNAQDHYT